MFQLDKAEQSFPEFITLYVPIKVGHKRKSHKMSRTEQKLCLFLGGGCSSDPVVAPTCLCVSIDSPCW